MRPARPKASPAAEEGARVVVTRSEAETIRAAEELAKGSGALPRPSGPNEADPLIDVDGLDLMPESVV